MEPVRPDLLPDPDLSREEMEALQRDVAAAAVVDDDLPFDPAAVRIPSSFDLSAGVPTPGGGGTQQQLGESDGAGDGSAGERAGSPVVAGVDQAFLDDRALSAVVAVRGDRVVERAHALASLDVPYVPGLLSFREGEAILASLEALRVDPDLLVLDGSGRIHYRQAGIATHVGVVLDAPAVGVAKNLLCGEPARSLDDPLPEGTRVDVLADGRVDASRGTVIGQAYQSRQYDSPNRHVNPLFVSPGHRLGVDTATDLVERCCTGYKLPEPTRLADAYADEVKRRLG
jgi:deoxyribonuclease V